MNRASDSEVLESALACVQKGYRPRPRSASHQPCIANCPPIRGSDPAGSGLRWSHLFTVPPSMKAENAVVAAHNAAVRRAGRGPHHVPVATNMSSANSELTHANLRAGLVPQCACPIVCVHASACALVPVRVCAHHGRENVLGLSTSTPSCMKFLPAVVATIIST